MSLLNKASNLKFFVFWNRINSSEKISLLIVFIFFVSLPITLFASHQTTENRPKAAVREFQEPRGRPVLLPQPTSVPDNKIIMKVGQENIYQKDLNTEMSFYPKKDDSAKKLLLNKMAEESKFLQLAQEEKLITLDESVYNSYSKDYLKRIDLVQKIKKQLLQTTNKISGTIVSIWFLNNHVGSLGYDKAKQLAWEKINYYYDKVKKGESIESVITQIQDDTSLKTLDPNYKINASVKFSISPTDKITWESGFDNKLKQLDEGAVTDIYTGISENLDSPGKEKVPAYYMFGQVKEKKSIINNSDTSAVIKSKTSKYEVVNY